MKKTITICMVAVVAFACQKQESFIDTDFVAATIEVGVPTKTVMATDGKMSWKSSDNLSVFTDTDVPDGVTNYRFNIQNISEDGKGASFASSVASNEARTNIYVMYPYANSYDNNPLAAKVVNISYPISHGFMESRLIMAGKGSVAGNDFKTAAVEMEHLTWVWEIMIKNPSQKSISSVQLSASEKIFPYSGAIDLTADNFRIEPGKYASVLSYNFTNATSEESVLARFPIFPMNANPDVDLEIIVTFEDGRKETFARKAPSVATVAGKRYQNTYTLGEGEFNDLPTGWTLVKKGDDFVTKLKNQLSDDSISEVKLYVESSPTEAYTYSLGSGRLNPTKSIYISSNPDNIKPVFTAASGSTFEMTTANVTGLTLSLKNIAINNTASGDFLQISNNGISIDLLEIDNCVLSGYQHSIVRTSGQNVPSGVSFAGAVVSSIRLNNSIFRMKAPAYSERALLFFQKTSDSMGSVSVTDCTFENMFALIWNKMYSSSGRVDVDVHNNTFVNTAGKMNNTTPVYFIKFDNGVNGTVDVSDNLWGGTNNVTSVGLLKSNQVVAKYSGNYACSDWMETYTHVTENRVYDIAIATSETSDVFNDIANFDLTLKVGTSAYEKAAGDPRWLE